MAPPSPVRMQAGLQIMVGNGHYDHWLQNQLVERGTKEKILIVFVDYVLKGSAEESRQEKTKDGCLN